MVRYDLGETLKRLVAYQDENELSNSRLAKLIGLGAATLSELRGGKYKGSAEQVLAKINRFLNYEERRLVEGFVDEEGFEPVATRPFQAITALCQYAQNRGVGAIVLGDAGVGKSTALKAYAAENPNAYYVACDETMWGRAQLIRAIGQAVHVQHLSRSFWVRRDVVEALHGTRGVLLLDDAHFLSIGSLNAIQTLHDATRVGFVLSGLPRLHAQMARGRDAEWFAQIRSRCAAMRLLDSAEPSRENIIEAARIAGGGIDIDPGAENILVEQARVPGALRRVRQIIGLAATYAGKGKKLTARDVQKAVAYRGGI
ncbi:MAG TPA: AAA family ATPase [Sumerlaeia bacterium]|nr:AAA family ATPase [Sumerlaeia bacterium]